MLSEIGSDPEFIPPQAIELRCATTTEGVKAKCNYCVYQGGLCFRVSFPSALSRKTSRDASMHVSDFGIYLVLAKLRILALSYLVRNSTQYTNDILLHQGT